jgi:hypothetical protein
MYQNTEPIESFDDLNHIAIEINNDINIEKKSDEKSTSTDKESNYTNSKNEFKKIKNDILKEFIYPKYKNDLIKFSHMSKKWSLASSLFLIMKYFFLLASPIFSLAENSFKIKNESLRFITASFSLLGLGCDQMHKFCNSNSKKYNDKINDIYQIFSINVKNIDDLIDDKAMN